MSDCIFCKIANHEIPSDIVYENDEFVAFKDLNPQAPVHVLVVPKQHFASVADSVPAPVMGGLLQAAVEVARITGVDKDGFRLIMNTGANAGQTVPHLHCHVLGGIEMSEGLLVG